MFFAFFTLVCLIFLISSNLLFIIILLEVVGFVVMYYVALTYTFCVASDYIVLLVFSILVIEGVIALCGLIMLVSYSGSDYLMSSLFLKI